MVPPPSLAPLFCIKWLAISLVRREAAKGVDPESSAKSVPGARRISGDERDFAMRR
jgi:hypothetical protein